jgi:hypothetical protein
VNNVPGDCQTAAHQNAKSSQQVSLLSDFAPAKGACVSHLICDIGNNSAINNRSRGDRHYSKFRQDCLFH